MPPQSNASVAFLNAYGIINGLLMAFGLLANALVVLVVVSSRKMRSSGMNCLLANLAIADFLVIIYSPPSVASLMLRHVDLYDDWNLPAGLCAPYDYFGEFTWTATVFTFVAIALERYIAVVHPLHCRLVRAGHMVGVCIGIWILAALYKLPELLSYRAVAGEGGKGLSCMDVNDMPSKGWGRVYRGSQIILQFFFPLLIAILLYTRICLLLWRRDPMAHGREPSMNRELSFQQQKQKAELAKRKNSVKMVIASIALFIVCYTPRTILDIATVITGHDLDFHTTPLPHEIYLSVNSLIVVCSAFNPLIYTIFSTNFRERMMAAVKLRRKDRSGSEELN